MNKKRDSLIKLNSNIYRCTQAYLDQKLIKYELTIGTYPYLMVLNREPGISQNDISRELNIDKAMSARSIKKLIELGYIIKEENEEDVRAYKLYITEKAKIIIPDIRKIIFEWIDILVEGYSDEEVEIIIGFLERVLVNGKNYRKKQCERMKKG
ncbi:winged helix-turn-helix transcriptional regulator [Clostridium sp. 19966]|uniref:MarR family winged helix-turn-helix transcriptional regulator n=1 Tax=Clostridium sp. 19966 TaxID=2768166 RepID=UPI0028DFA659|nr:MarR family winged helix-turn-helix transcriptional regulator [Clostridium sp. 19966]MDT8715623.1 winged helix-turn-helix transcriptional regulator [Clostridium sp. 19966]